MRICLDPGHGGEDRGCQYNGIDEADYTWLIANKLGRALSSQFSRDQDRSIHIQYTRIGDETVSLQQRAEIANAYNTDLFLSIHVNATTNAMTQGAISFYWPGSKEMRRVMSAMVQRMPYELSRTRNYLFKAENLPDDDRDDWLERPIQVLKRPYAKWKGLIEIAYASNPEDANYLQKDCSYIAIVASLMSGISEALNLKGV